MKNRDQIEEKYKWDLSNYFTSVEKWEEEFNKTKPLYEKLTTYEGRLNDDSVLLECLNLEKEINERVGRLIVYISLKTKEDGKNSFYQNKYNILEKYLSDVAPSVAYISSEINEFSNERLNDLAGDERFEDFNIMLKNVIKNKPHMLGKSEEKLLAMLGNSLGGSEQVFDMLDSVDLKFDDAVDINGNKHELNHATYSVFVQSDDKVLRESAFKNFNGAYGKLNYTVWANYLNNIKTDCTLAKVRQFESAFNEALFAEDVDGRVYKTLVEQVTNNINVFYRYFELKRKALGLSEIFNFDMNAKLKTKNTKEFSYDEAFAEVVKALNILGEDYIEVLNSAKQNRWIDVMPNENKDTGAFSWGAYGANPVVMLNFDGTINSVFTLAHELGHMMHTYYSDKNNSSTKAGYEIFVAEVASTVNEMLLARKLMGKAIDKQEKLFYVDYLLNTCYATICRQTMFAEFEYKMHNAYENGDDVTAEAMNNAYVELAQKYFGNNVQLADEIKYEWSRIPHFYNSFYVYKYATGLISALAICNKIYNNESGAVEAYKAFLCLGGTKPPVELLKVAGVDLNNKNTFENAFEFISEILDEFEKLL